MNQQPKSTQQKSNSNKKKRSWYLALFLVVAGAALLLILPSALRIGLETWLNKQPDIVAHIDDIDINLFSATLGLNGVMVQQHDKPVFAAQRLQLQLDWLPLLQQRVAINHVTLEEGLLQLNQDSAHRIQIGGFILNSATPTAEDSALAPKLETQQDHQSWDIASGDINIKNFLINFHLPELDLQLTINSLAATPTISWQPQLSATLGCDLNINGAPVQIDALLQPYSQQPSVSGDLSINNFALSSIAPLLSTLGWNDVAGDLSSQLHLSLSAETTASAILLGIDGTITGTGISGANSAVWLRQLNFNWQGDSALDIFSPAPEVVLQGQLTITDSDLELQQPGYRWLQHGLVWDGTTKITTPPDTQNSTVDISGDLQLEQTTIIELAQQRQLAHIAQATVSALQLNADAEFSCDKIQLHNMQALQHITPNHALAHSASSRPTIAPDDIATFADIELDKLVYTSQLLHADSLHLAGVNLDIVRTSSGALEIEQWLNSMPTPEDAPEQITAKQPAADPLVFSVDRILLDENSSLSFSDNKLATPTSWQLSSINLALDNLHSAKGDQYSPIAFTALLDQYSHIDLSGTIQPFRAPANFDINGKIKGFNLPSVSAYCEESIGYALNQGQLDIEFTAPCTQGQLNMDSNIFLSQLRMQPLSATADSEVTATLGMPVNLALALLRDRSGNIQLNLPVRGNLNDPSLQIAPTLRRALTNTIKNTVMLTLAPLGIVAKAGQLVGIGAALNFERLTFEAGTTTLTNTSTKYLPKVAQLLVSHPQLVATIKGRITAGDIELLQQQLTSKSTGTSSTPAPSASSTIPAQQLEQLANQRANIVKQALLEQQVANGQLLVTKPQSNISSGNPGVDLTIK
ncbi:MAG: DUF748 domain-containing protein [Desulfuromonas sp.]|nr:DUF748 domain-containing protein [Desulfuromonas sp.]